MFGEPRLDGDGYLDVGFIDKKRVSVDFAGFPFESRKTDGMVDFVVSSAILGEQVDGCRTVCRVTARLRNGEKVFVAFQYIRRLYSPLDSECLVSGPFVKLVLAVECS